MKKELRTLIIEDSDDDTLLQVKHLEREGYKVDYLRVQTKDELEAALGKQEWDVVLSDFTMPHFSGTEALQLVRKKSKHLPFIFVSGTIGEDRAVEAMKNGANDYVLKDNLKRLAPSIERELRDTQLRIKSERAEKALLESETRLSLVFNNTSDMHVLMEVEPDEKLRMVAVNRSFFDSLKHLNIDPSQSNNIVGKYRDETLAALGFSKEDYDAEKRHFLRAIESGTPVQYEQSVPFGALTIHLNSTIVPVLDAEGRCTHVLYSARDITGQKKAEETRLLLTTALESAASGVTITDVKGNIVWVNKAFTGMTGYDLDEVIGQNPRILKSGKQDDLFYQRLWETIVAGNVWTGELINKKKDGSLYTDETTITPLKDVNGKITHFIAIKQDITERKRILEALELSERSLKEAQKVAHIGSWNLDRTTGVLNWSEELYHIYEVNPKEVTPSYEVVMDAVHPDDREWVARSYADSVKDKTSFDGVHRLLMRDGRVKYVHEQFSNFFDDTGKPLRSTGTLQDITERKLADDAMAASRELHKSMIASSPDAILLIDTQGHIIECNEVMLKLIGAERKGEIIGSDVFEFLGRNRAEHAKARQNIRDVLRDGIVKNIEYTFVNKDGGEFPVEVSAALIRDAAGMPKSFVAVLKDITERNRAIEKIREQAALLDESHDAISVMDLDTGMVFWNKGAEELFGWKTSEVLGKNQWELSVNGPPGGDSTERSANMKNLAFTDAAHQAAFTATLAEGTWKGEFRQKTRSGTEIEILSDWTLIRDAGGRPKSILFISTDISEHKALEAQYRRTQRMETLGTLASGIAHDLNNVLTPITLALEILQRKYADDEKTIRLLSTLESTVNRGTGVVRQILAFARGGEAQREHLDPATVIEDMKRIMEETFPKSIATTVKVEQGTGLITADKTQIHQVLMNLCINARDAMPKGGRLTISGRSAKIDESYMKMSRAAKPGDYVLIEVSDTGGGIKSENLDKLFEPFFTTKESGKGTGLGLSIVHGIVEAHGGFIEVESKLNKGTTFRVYLPSGIAQEVPINLELEVKPQLGQGELIIIADDEAAIREITKSTLEAYGYNVLDAGDGSEAVALFAQHSNEVALVLTDMVMPVMDGAATIRALRKMKPDLKIIAATGYTEEARYYELLDAVDAVLKKPYTAGTLMKSITQVLANVPQNG